MNGTDWPDRRLRHPVQLEAEIVHLDGRESPTIVTDLSLEGCRVNGWFLIGEPVCLRIPRIGLVRGQIRWAMNGRAGVRFHPSAETTER